MSTFKREIPDEDVWSLPALLLWLQHCAEVCAQCYRATSDPDVTDLQIGVNFLPCHTSEVINLITTVIQMNSLSIPSLWWQLRNPCTTGVNVLHIPSFYLLVLFLCMRMHICVTKLYGKHITANISKLVSFQALLSLQIFPFFAPHNSAPADAIFHGSSIRLGESFSALL